MRKKAIAIFVISALLLTLFTACGSKNGKQDESSQNSSSSAASASGNTADTVDTAGTTGGSAEGNGTFATQSGNSSDNSNSIDTTATGGNSENISGANSASGNDGNSTSSDNGSGSGKTSSGGKSQGSDSSTSGSSGNSGSSSSGSKTGSSSNSCSSAGTDATGSSGKSGSSGSSSRNTAAGSTGSGSSTGSSGNNKSSGSSGSSASNGSSGSSGSSASTGGSTGSASGSGSSGSSSGSTGSSGSSASNGSSGSSGTAAKIINNISYKIDFNSLAFDLKADLYENGLKQTFLKLEFYNNGQSVLKELSSRDIPEIDGIFERAKVKTADGSGNRIRILYLNTRKAKLYLMIEGGVADKAVDTAVYSYNLKDYSLTKVYSGKGIFTKLYFTPDRNFMAFSYSNATVPEVSLLQIVKCESDTLIINKNKEENGTLIANSKNTKLNYTVLSWNTNRVVKLLETVSGNASSQRELLYDLDKNTFFNPDGSEISDNGTAPKTVEGPAVKALRSFYLYLTTGQYDKAYDLLDDKFLLNAFKQLGATELDKADIDVQKFSKYGIFFQAARIKSIVKESLDGNIATIYYFQLLALDKGDQIQPLIVKMSNNESGWKVKSVVDGNPDEEPFK